MKNLLLLCLSLVGCLWVSAQDSTKVKDTTSASSKAGKLSRKKTTEYYKENYKRVRRKFDSTLFSGNNAVTTSDYAEELEKIYQMLNRVPIVTESFVRLDDIDDQLDQEDSALDILKDRMSQNERTFNVRNLQMFNTFLDALDQNVKSYTHYLNRYDTALDGVKKEIGNIRKDTLMLNIFRDSALKDTFKVQLQLLKQKWRQVDSLVALNGQQINALKSEASAHAITIQELQYRVDLELKAVGTKAFGKERRYLWEPRSPGGGNFTRGAFQKSVDSEKQLASYYFSNTRSKRFWLWITGMVFFYWVWVNFRALRRRDRLKAIESFQFSFIAPYPITGSLVFILILAPLFDLHAPALYIESIEFLLIIVLTFIFRKHLPRPLFYGWGIFFLLFLLLPITRILGLPLSLQRWTTLIIDGVSAVFAGYFLFGKGRLLKGQPRFIWFAGLLYFIFNILAVICNLFGRVTLSQIFAATAVYSFAQTASLAVFVRLVVEAFLLQIQSSRVRKNYPDNFDLGPVSKSIRRFITSLGVILWLIVVMTNLNIFDAANDLLVDFFTSPRQVGSFEFSFGGLLLFLGIIWLANFLQKYIAYFFGDTGDDASLDDRGQRSRLLVTRLVLLIGGFLLAVAASGLSVDRITVILGALGVGVGLGLQNIVNNFVSGIILIFDRPVRIGDTVEVGDKKGRVKEIGIRSSTLLTEEGAEVIIPNGDVLSNHIVNWTLSNNHVRVALAFTLEKPVDTANLQPDGIKEIVRNNSNVLGHRDAEIILNTLSTKTVELRVYFWVNDITRTPYTSGEIRSAIYHHLEKQNITVL
ncbi:MAG: mechanosensitive ion channel [Bacteroidetes bacterium]|nr:mechanosensitive ion channel [Bacteroidota bacterium]